MSASLTTRLHEQFAGEFSEQEQQLSARFRELLQAALAGRMTFTQATSGLWNDLSVLREFHYDLEQAMAAGKLKPAEPAMIALDSQSSPTVLSEAERTFVEDAEGLIDWVMRNGVSFSSVLQVLGHDVSELSRDDFNLQKMMGPGRRVVPKVAGWAKRNAEPVGDIEESL